MAVELIKDSLNIDEIKGKEEVQTLAEAEIYLEQTKPDIDKILWAQGKPEIISTKIVKDKLLISGVVNFKVVYKSTEESSSIQQVETTSDFREEIDIEGINKEMVGKGKVNIEHIEHEKEDERKISLRALVNIEGKVESSSSIEIVKDIKGGEGLETLKEKVRYNHLLGEGYTHTLIHEAFEVDDGMPDIDEVLKFDLMAYENESKVVDDKIIVSGTLECSLVYYGGKKINSIKKEISFNHFVDIEGAIKDSESQVKMDIEFANYEIKENLEGNLRILDLEIKVKIDGKVYEQREKEIILDAYSTKKEIDLERKNIEVVENVKGLQNKEIIEGNIAHSYFKEVYSIEGSSTILDSRIIEDKLILEGLIILNIIYLDSDSEEINTLREEIPFKSYVESEGIDETMAPEVESMVEDIDYKINDNKLILKVHLNNLIELNRRKNINIILNLEEKEEYIDKSRRPSITIYIVQSGDSLWNIAKRYNTTVDDIISSNDISSPDTLMPGEKIIIEKNVDMNF
ncbi:DUF3794 and LysM peptidoglycan-binding domain-containing protein [Anaerosalibacter bizertensis]|uniref:DUF3794 and LysM peptidoglycan-binding domain-containing protein n=1 Tax=Anaerosalibacter bizertensis TaxID=932217 RepID=UPI003516F636